MTPAATTAVYLVQAIVSALTAMGLFLLGRRMSGPLAARLAGWGWALHPTAAWYSIQQVWDTTLVAGGLVAIVLALVSMGRGPRPGRALAFGLGFGVLLLINPAPIGVLPVVLWYLAPGGGARAALLRIAAFGVGTLVVGGDEARFEVVEKYLRKSLAGQDCRTMGGDCLEVAWTSSIWSHPGTTVCEVMSDLGVGS